MLLRHHPLRVLSRFRPNSQARRDDGQSMKRKRLKRGRIGRTEKLRVPAGGTKDATGLVQDLEAPPRGS